MELKTELILGAKYRDTISGWEGVCTAIHHYLNGCVRSSLDAVDKEGKPLGYVFDEEQLVLVREKTEATEVAKKRKPSGGPRDNTQLARR